MALAVCLPRQEPHWHVQQRPIPAKEIGLAFPFYSLDQRNFCCFPDFNTLKLAIFIILINRWGQRFDCCRWSRDHVMRGFLLQP